MGSKWAQTDEKHVRMRVMAIQQRFEQHPATPRGSLLANMHPTLSEISICQQVVLSGSSSSHPSASYPSSSLRAE